MNTLTIKTELPAEVYQRLDDLLSCVNELTKKVEALTEKQASDTLLPVPGRTTVKDFCRRFGIPISTYYYGIKDGRYPPVVKIGCRAFVDNAQIIKWSANPRDYLSTDLNSSK